MHRMSRRTTAISPNMGQPYACQRFHNGSNIICCANRVMFAENCALLCGRQVLDDFVFDNILLVHIEDGGRRKEHRRFPCRITDRGLLHHWRYTPCLCSLPLELVCTRVYYWSGAPFVQPEHTTCVYRSRIAGKESYIAESDVGELWVV